MGLSSNSIIHFTRESEALKGILRDNFRINYCKETIILDKKMQYAAPLVSFCDIPLSNIKDHIGKYGTYGIGLRKEWAERMGLNPVFYIQSGSELAKSYVTLYRKFFSESRSKKGKELDNFEQHNVNLLRYIKNYEGDLERGKNVIQNYRFSDEREWRYTPSFDQCTNMAINVALIDTDKNKRKYNESISHLRLEFEPNDIKYIIIDNESEISDFLDVLKDSKRKKYTYDDVERLMTRIITTEQIFTDF